MRGVAPSIVCPRCGLEMPPQGEAVAFVPCPGCGLTVRAAAAPAPSLAPAVRAVSGEFRTLAVGIGLPPFPIAGRGTCELTEACLVVRGLRPRSRWLRRSLVLGGLVAGGAAAVTLARSDAPGWLAATALVTAVSVAALAPLPAARLPVRFHVPWEKIRRIRAPGMTLHGLLPDTLTVEVVDFAPMGEIHFRTAEATSLVKALRARARG